MRIAIVDDLASDLEKLHADVCKWVAETQTPLVPPPALFSSGEKLLKDIEDNSYDIIFLDIYMSGINGMDTARKIRALNQDCRIVFTTITPEFAVESYDVDSSYYLLKPYTREKFFRAMSRCCASVLEQNQCITLSTKTGEEILYLHNIAYTEYASRHVMVHMKNGADCSLSMRQSDLADALLEYPYFCDCMKGMLVNFEAVDKLEKNRFLLKDGRYIPISRLKYPNVREKFLEYSYATMRGNNQ